MGCEFKFMLTLAKMLASEHVSAKLSIYEDNWSSDLISALRETAFRVSQRVLNAAAVCGRLHVATVCGKILKTDALHVGGFAFTLDHVERNCCHNTFSKYYI